MKKSPIKDILEDWAPEAKLAVAVNGKEFIGERLEEQRAHQAPLDKGWLRLQNVDTGEKTPSAFYIPLENIDYVHDFYDDELI